MRADANGVVSAAWLRAHTHCVPRSIDCGSVIAPPPLPASGDHAGMRIDSRNHI